MTPTEILSETDAAAYLKGLTTPSSDTDISEFSSKDDDTFEQNKDIIEAADEIILDRLQNPDGSLSIKDVIAAKDTAFKQNRAILWKDDEWPALIPSVINIQIINN